MLALLNWLMGALIAFSGFCALACLVSLVITIAFSFRSLSCLRHAVAQIIFSFVSLGVCWLLVRISEAIANHTGHQMHYWIVVGMVIPGILGVGLVQMLVKSIVTANRTTIQRLSL
jgi:hypothetical protein